MKAAPFLLLVATAAAATGPLLLAGLPASFASSGQDVGPALLWLHDFAAEIARGACWPRWLWDGNRGFGSPVFLFYPPVAYWAAAAVRRALRLDAAEALLVSAVLWRAGASVLAYVWLRTRVLPCSALFGAAFFSLHAYNMLVNPLVRFAYAEMAGTCAVLAALITVGARRAPVWAPPAFALLILTHLPSAVLAGGILPAWSFAAAGAGREGLLRAATTFAACGVGAAMAAAYLLPAVLLLPGIDAEGWVTGGLTTWSGHFLLDAWSPSKPMVQFLFMNAGLVTIAASLPLLAWIGRRQVPPLRDRFFAAAAVLLAVLCLLMTRLSWPVWAALPPLQRVQFPWRLMPFAAAVWAMLAGRRLDGLAAAGLRGGAWFAGVLVLLLAAAALWIPYSAWTAERPSFARYGWTRLQFAPPGPRPLPARSPEEYTPRAAALAGWRADDPATDAPLLDRLARSRAAAPGVRIGRDEPRALRLRGRLDAPAVVVLPQFAFPGWSKGGQPADAALSTDPATGLLRLDLPAGEQIDITVFRAATGPERAGWVVSAAAVLVWLALAIGARHPWARAFGARGRSA
jgi:hypothetical protein